MKQKTTTTKDAVELMNEIKQSLHDDILTALDIYSKTGTGFFAIPRLIFPEIDNLGAYMAGTTKNSPKNAIAFIKKYYAIINPEYTKKGALIYFIYRHGLMHQHVPKFVSYRKKNIGWQISLTMENTKSTHLMLMDKTIILEGRQLYTDTIFAIDEYIKDLQSDKKVLNNLIIAHQMMMSPINKTALLKNYKNYIKQADLNFLK
ncbi:MAG: hypothetical protein WCV71_02050 [Patescibacteria group bacterium]